MRNLENDSYEEGLNLEYQQLMIFAEINTRIWNETVNETLCWKIETVSSFEFDSNKTKDSNLKMVRSLTKKKKNMITFGKYKKVKEKDQEQWAWKKIQPKNRES